MHVELGRVPETLLWNLYNRAAEARRPDRILDDPLAVRLFDQIHFPFAERFGKASWGQAQALRSRRFDDAVREFLAVHPAGTVVALGEGLETQFWRVDNGTVNWLTVELPEVVELRERMLPASPRLRVTACSAFDLRWMESVDPAAPVLITAQGLFMYFERAEVEQLVDACARRFHGGTLLFDAVPRWLSESTLEGTADTRDYKAPPMHWGMDGDETQEVLSFSPCVASVEELPPQRGRGLFYGWLAPLLQRIPLFRNRRLPTFPWLILQLRFVGIKTKS